MQTTVLSDYAVAKEGMVDTGGQIDSFAAKTALPVGRFVCRDGTDLNSVRLPALTTEVTGTLMAGVTIWLPSREPKDPNYAALDMVSVLRRGRIWMLPEDACALEDSVFVRFTAGNEAQETIGRIRSDNDTTPLAAVAPGCRFLTEAVAEALILVEVNIP